ncbi:MAG: hypothetical protein HC924_18740, partial [Synechococcaceae cyanobacterium SM2_3_2]|nr:hypothetical protein [Synechococcaceae cyanobacterium SM2_3_2]
MSAKAAFLSVAAKTGQKGSREIPRDPVRYGPVPPNQNTDQTLPTAQHLYKGIPMTTE